MQHNYARSGGTPEVSVVVVNWNRREMLRGCLESLARQNGPCFEVVVIDNGSTDGSAGMVEAFKNSSKMRVSVIKNDENRGFCAANNQGIAVARGEYVALLNNDAEAEPGWLDAMLRVARRHPEAGMVSSKIVVWEDPARIDKVGHLIWPDGQNRGRGTGQIDRGQYDREEELLWPDGCAALYRRSMLEEIGGFDEDLFAYADDAELGMRARLAGWTCWHAPDAVVRHRRGATLGVMSSRRVELIERNRVLLAVKHFPASLLWLNLPYFALRLTGGLIAGLRGRGEAGRFAGPGAKVRMAAALLRGFAQGVVLIPRTWRKRRAMRPLRRLGPRETRQLLMQYRISLRELSEGAN